MRLTRRHLLHGTLAATAATVLARPALAAPQPERTTVVVVDLPGGSHSLYGQADSFVPVGWYGCTASNVRDVGNGVVVDAATFGTLGDDALAKMCNLGVWHDITAHDRVRQALSVDALGKSYPLQLAHAMGGDSAVACANLGDSLGGTHNPIGTVNLSKIADVGGVLAALGAGTPTEYTPSRELALSGLKASMRMSLPTLSKNRRTLQSVTGGLNSVVRALMATPSSLNWATIAGAYGLGVHETQVSGFASQFAAAELLVHAGTNVVLISGGGPNCTLGWDTHGDHSGDCARVGMTQLVLPSLRTFLSRTLDLPGHNVITMVMGDFTRAALAEHAGMLVANVWGPHLKPGTTGNFRVVGGEYRSPNDQHPGLKEMWSFLAAAAGVVSNPFGANPHPFV